MIVFGIHCNFLIALPIRLKTCRPNVFFLFTKQNVLAKICLRGFVHPSAPDRHRRPLCPGVFENDSERSIKKTAKLQLVQQSMGFKLSKSFPRELKQVSHSEKFLS